MNIVLLQPPENLDRVLGSGKHFVMPIPPVGLMYIASYLEREGHPVEILDAYFHKYDLETTVREVLEKRPDILGISCLTSNGANVYYLVKLLKEKRPTLKIVLGNVHASYFSSFYLRHAGADYIVHGEGEETMLALVQSIAAQKKDFSEIPNLSWKTGMSVIDNKRATAQRRLDDYPWPARHLIPFRKYVEGVYAETKVRDTDMVFSSRGCVNRCTFCCIGFQHKFRMRNPVDVVDEIEYLINEYSIKSFTFGDSLFMANAEHVACVCHELIKRKISIPWLCEGHAKYADEGLLELMKRAGCSDVCYGIETGTPRIMKEIRKNTTLEEITRAIRITKKANIRVSGLFMLGFPGESEEEMMQTIRFALSVPLDRAQFAITVPYPGSPLYDQLIDSGKLTVRDEMDPLFVEDWYRYSAYISYTKEDPIWFPDGIKPEQLKRLQKQALRRFYIRPKQLFNEIRKVRPSSIRHIISFIKGAFDTFF